MAYTGRAARTGNSRGFRFESALFTAHPEFATGDVEADVIAPGRLLVRARVHAQQVDDDPVLDAFLAFLADQMRRHPDRIDALTPEDVAGLDELLAGVEYGADEKLDDAFELP
jgi:antitoxin PrlF